MNLFLKGMKAFGENIAAIINSTLLFFVYIIGIGITRVFARLTKKSFLDTKRKKSYWNSLNLKKLPMEEYYRQF